MEGLTGVPSCGGWVDVQVVDYVVVQVLVGVGGRVTMMRVV